ncbi:MAG: hypothetical protein WC451_00740 [Patescibacteria group bacterium]
MNVFGILAVVLMISGAVQWNWFHWRGYQITTVLFHIGAAACGATAVHTTIEGPAMFVVTLGFCGLATAFLRIFRTQCLACGRFEFEGGAERRCSHCKTPLGEH